MPVPFYKLDDRSYEDLVSDMLARVPGHTPEWTNPSPGDPGRTLIELFAWLADTILYRANLIPERQRLAFLRLLNIPMRPAIAAKGILSLQMANYEYNTAVTVPLHTMINGTVSFETVGEVAVLPLSANVYAKRKPTEDELASLSDVVVGLESVYGFTGSNPYIVTQVFQAGPVKQQGFDCMTDTVDGCFWIALLANNADSVGIVREALRRDEHGAKVLNIGVVPRIDIPTLFEEIGERAAVPHSWEITSSRVNANGEPEYLTLDALHDSSVGLSQQGVIRLVLPDADDIGVPENDVDIDINAGVGNRAPRIDDSELAARIITWIRLRPETSVNSLALSWLGINAVSIDQRKTLSNVIVATSNGAADQIIQLPVTSIEEQSFQLQVEEPERGYIPWHALDNLTAASRDDRVFQLDAEAGTISFGNGVYGMVPNTGMRIRVVMMRHGGGAQGNLPATTLEDIVHPKLKAYQPIATSGGQDSETLEQAELRIPATLKHGNRAITEHDYQRIALDTPAVQLGRVEVLPRFKPHQRTEGVPGVVSVMVLPKSATRTSPNPRPDAVMLKRVHAYLDQRRALGTELYVIGVEYVPIGISVGVSIRDGNNRDEVLRKVRTALYDYLWPLSPGGITENGWPLGQSVDAGELEVVVARVPGIRTVMGIKLFKREAQRWTVVQTSPARISLQNWQLPELLSVKAVEASRENEVPGTLDTTLSATGRDTKLVPIPVVPEVC
jgi:hypothetical protein